MSYRDIKRVLGESSIERKIRILFGICLLFLIASSFLWVNHITEDLIRRNTRDKANGLKPDFILRTHLRNQKFTDAYSSLLFEQLASDPPATPYTAVPLVLSGDMGRHQLNPEIATDPEEIQRLQKLLEPTIAEQARQNGLEIRKKYGPRDPPTASPVETPEAQSAGPSPEFKNAEDDFTIGNQYVYYTPLIFKSNSQCMECHFPVAKNPEILPGLKRLDQKIEDESTESAEERKLVAEKLSLAPPVFLRITLDNKNAKGAITKNRAILISVAIITAVFSVAAIWLIVRYVIVKPLAHLRAVTEKVSQGSLDVRADLNTGDEFGELSRSFNRMLRHLHDTQMALQTANDDLDSKVDEQAQMNLKLHEMNQIKSDFLANMSHELRTPLNSIIGFSEILESAKGMEPKQTRFAANIRNSGRLLLDLINDILDLAKLESGKMEVNPDEFPIDQPVCELIEMVRNLAETKNIQLTAHIRDGVPPVYQDKVKVRQILTNLLSNAIKFTPEGGRINVTAEHTVEDRLQIRVADTGVGIAESDRQIVFEKFRQGVSAIGDDLLTREVSGTGLGLSIVKELCILLGGQITLESEVGKGSTFIVDLPWNLDDLPQMDSELSQSIDELTKPSRVDFGRTQQSIKPPS